MNQLKGRQGEPEHKWALEVVVGQVEVSECGGGQDVGRDGAGELIVIQAKLTEVSQASGGRKG